MNYSRFPKVKLFQQHEIGGGLVLSSSLLSSSSSDAINYNHSPDGNVSETNGVSENSGNLIDMCTCQKLYIIDFDSTKCVIFLNV